MAQKSAILRIRAEDGLDDDLAAAAARDRRSISDEAALALEIGLRELAARHQIISGRSQIDVEALARGRVPA